MKKILGILSIFTGLGLIVCFILGMSGTVSAEVPSSSVNFFKVLSSFELFLKFLPSVIFTGFVVSCSIVFGQNPEGSIYRFSQAMFNRFKTVMISALICTMVLTFCNEVFGLRIRQRKEGIVNQPKIVNEYIKVGNDLFDEGHYERALRYAQAALDLDKDSEPAMLLRDKADLEINRVYTSNLRLKLYENEEKTIDFDIDHAAIDAQKISDVYTYFVMAQKAFDNEEWFNAHYYAETGISLATPKDPNLDSLKQLSASAWNNITQQHNLTLTEEQKIFNQKYEGYLALVERDDLKAYYIFRNLYFTSHLLQIDPEVNFYLDVAENRVTQRYFFVDETFELKSFESANDVCFYYNYEDGSCDVVYFKGMSAVKATGSSIQYLRGLTIVSLDRFGQMNRIMTVPYAKVLPVSVKSINSSVKSLMGLNDKIDYVPYIMLTSVGRTEPNTETSPTYVYANGSVASTPEYLILPISFDDFIMLENSTSNPNNISVFNLFKLVRKTSMYGYSEESYGQILLNRLFYPLIVLIFFLLLGSFGWNNRVGLNQYFKFSWIFSFPFFMVIGWVFYHLGMYIFKLLNYVLLGLAGSTMSILVGLVFYVIVLLIVSLYFLSRTSRD